MNNDYLIHHGIKGQRWGVRRYQNKDGSLTDAGKKKAAYMDTYKNAKKGVQRIQSNAYDRARGKSTGRIVAGMIAKNIAAGFVSGFAKKYLGDIADNATSDGAAWAAKMASISIQGAAMGYGISNTVTGVTAAVQRGRGRY